MPLAAWLAFRGGMGIHGFWWGVAAGAAVQVCGGWQLVQETMGCVCCVV